MTSSGYDAFLLLGFGGPEGPDDVMPFLRNVTRGRGVPDERLADVAEHYHHFGGVSPINAQNRALLDALGPAFIAQGLSLPRYWGNRNWHPLLADVVGQMARDGVRRALVLATSATGGYSGCRQYRENLAEARAVVGPSAPELVKLRHFYNHPGFISANVHAVHAALAQLPGQLSGSAHLLFTAHSVPTGADAQAGPGGGLYSAQQREAARLVAEAVRGPGAAVDLAWQSRSGPAQVPWLEPDVNDRLRQLAAAGVEAVVVCPTGFISDHLEVRWDLDVEAAATARSLGLTFVRAATAGVHPDFVAAIAELAAERVLGIPRRALGPAGPSWDECRLAEGCCAPRRARVPA